MGAGARLRVGAVLLAGGASRRFGADNKLLASVDGQPMIARVAREIVGAGVDDIVVVTGAEHQGYVTALSGLPVRIISNANWNDGIGGSIAAGARALATDLDGAFVVPGDLHNLSAAVFRRLIEKFSEHSASSVIVPVTADSEQRNPVLWPNSLFPHLAQLTGAKGGKSLLDTLAEGRVDVAFDDERLFADIDTTDDYARFISGA
jgi:molybdenum cofactor cytidylyltransferase